MVCERVDPPDALTAGRCTPDDVGSGVLFPLPKVSQNCEFVPPNWVSYCFLRSASCLSFSSWSCFCRSWSESFVAAGFEEFEMRLAKLSLAGVVGFEGALKGRLFAKAPDCCAERGVDRPESWGVGVWRKEGKFDCGFAVGLAGADQSRPERSSMFGCWVGSSREDD
jgi:hypothetical protein